MGKMLRKLGTLITGNEPAPRTSARRMPKLTRRDLIRMESKIGAQLFGAIPKGHRREFFCLDAHTWIWYEEWTEKGKKQSATIRYEIHPNGILKVHDGKPYEVVEGQELRNLAMATRLYREYVIRDIYHRDYITGQPLSAPGTIKV